MIRPRNALLGSLVLAGLLATPGVSGAAEYTVTIADMAFGAVPDGLKLGDTITWQNRDIFEHTATARDGSFDVDLPAGAEVRMTLTKAGRIDFYCQFHPGMTGTLVVSQ